MFTVVLLHVVLFDTVFTELLCCCKHYTLFYHFEIDMSPLHIRVL
jgi:hypothetical protein